METAAKSDKPQGEDDLSMEEILQSIRKIIAEDGDEKKDGGSAAAEKAGGASMGSDVLELTDMVQEDGSVVNIKDAGVKSAEQPSVASAAPVEDVLGTIDKALAAAASEAPAEAPVRDAPALSAPVAERARPAADESLLSPEAAGAAADALRKLVKDKPLEPMPFTPSPAFRSGMTVEDLVVELLKPMLKEWLDTNLPPMVQRIVEKEVRRISQ